MGERASSIFSCPEPIFGKGVWAPAFVPRIVPVGRFNSDAVNNVLGADALELLAYLRNLYGSNTQAFPLRATMARACGFPEGADGLARVRTALKVLTAAGLHKYLGKQVPHERVGELRKKFHCRLVVEQELRLDRRNEWVSSVELRRWAAEEEAQRAARLKAGHGGRRAGAGRPCGSKSTVAVPQQESETMSRNELDFRLEGEREELSSSSSLRDSENPIARARTHAFKKQDSNLQPDDNPPVLASTPGEPPPEPGYRGSPRLGGSLTPVGAAARLGAGGGLRLPLEGHRLKTLGARALPPFPGPDVIKPVVVPGPAKISPGCSDLEAVKMLVWAYQDSVESRWPGQRCWSFRRGEITKSKHWPLLLAAATRMRELEIAPGAWCLFSADVWREHSTAVSPPPPPPTFVFAKSRMENRLDWFDDECDRYRGGRALFAPAHLALAQRWKDLWRDLHKESPQDRPRLLVILERHFPGDSWERGLAQARDETEALRRTVTELVKRGVSSW